MVDPAARPGQHPTRADDGHQRGERALHRLSTGAHNLPVSPLDPPQATGSVGAALPAALRRYGDGEGIW